MTDGNPLEQAIRTAAAERAVAAYEALLDADALIAALDAPKGDSR